MDHSSGITKPSRTQQIIQLSRQETEATDISGQSTREKRHAEVKHHKCTKGPRVSVVEY